MARVLDVCPDLAGDLAGSALAAASAAAIAPLLHLETGLTAFVVDRAATDSHFGFLLLDGVMLRHVTFGHVGSTEFLGPGDVLRPWPRRGSRREIAEVRWEVLTPARLAVLDPDFAGRVRPWPQIHAGLLDRTGLRADSQALQASLRQAGRVEDRVLLALWHFAGRWGEVGAEGRTVSLANLTGEVLARFVGARRQSVSTALGKLSDSGALRRGPGRTVHIPNEPPELQEIQPGRRATDRPPRIRYAS